MKDYIASTVFMVHPTSFGFDEQTATTNTFQQKPLLTPDEIQQKAETEFRTMAEKIRDAHINVITFEDTSDPPKPNAVFPNNWMSTWPDGRIFLYPMATESRRRERNPLALVDIQKTHSASEVINITASEHAGEFLESTGAIVFDHRNRVAYGCISPRCSETVFREHVAEIGYKPVLFRASDENGTPIYHTNVMLGVQEQTAILCAEAIEDPLERELLVETLQATGHTVLTITYDQMRHYCANVLQLQNGHHERFLIVSQTALDSFSPAQCSALADDNTLLPVKIPTIEAIGGGSARCMLAEIFLPERKRPISIQSRYTMTALL